jgi:hypothetical protein
MEKFQVFRRRKAILFCASFLGLMVFIFVACRQDSITFDTASTKLVTADTELAKAWFTDYQKTKESIETPEFRLLQPQWHQAFATKKGMEIPILIDGKMPMMKIKNKTNDKGRQRLILIKQGNTFEGTLISYMPSNGFKDPIYTINSTNIVEKKFSGIISFRPLNNPNRLSLSNFENGKLIKRRVGHIVNVRETISTRSICEEEEEVCTDWYQVVSQGGEIISITYLDTSCETVCIRWGDDNNGGDDPCNSSNPPSWCFGDDPCSGPNPSTYCNGTGGTGCTDPDPCVCDPNGAGCNECICQTQSAEIPLKSIIWDISNKDYISLVLTSMDCKTGQSDIDLSHFIQETYPGSITFANEYARRYFVAPIYPDKPNCGKNVTFICHSVVTYSRWLPSNQNLPAVVTMHDYKSINFD